METNRRAFATGDELAVPSGLEVESARLNTPSIEFDPPLRQPRAKLETLKQAAPKLKEQLRSSPKKWAGIAAGAGIALGLTGRYLRHRAHRRLVVVETTAC
jgi:hypothetical protein